MGKRQIEVRELKDNLSATLARVRRGESITVTDRNRAVAVIVPARASVVEDRRLARLAESSFTEWDDPRDADYDHL